MNKLYRVEFNETTYDEDDKLLMIAEDSTDAESVNCAAFSKPLAT